MAVNQGYPLGLQDLIKLNNDKPMKRSFSAKTSSNMVSVLSSLLSIYLSFTSDMNSFATRKQNYLKTHPFNN